MRAFDVGEGFLFGKAIQMNGQTNGVSQGLQNGKAELHGQLFSATDQHREGVVGADLEVCQQPDLL